ncbi:hypothetical protein RB653_010128 [Dictyostelium firmibasis]|uniref:EGF-like domain-containing protein n=1 Tax=Dictyostelium firmibasis TaxID=79012 RepID=A0AAN7TL36_9MYCE
MKYFIIFFIYLSTFFNGFNCVVPPIDQYNCLLSFVSKYNITSLYPILNTTHYDFCSSFECDSITGFVVSFIVSNTASSGYNGSPIFPTDLQCCPYIGRIYFNGFNVSKELIYNKFPQKVNDITYTFGNNQCYPIDQQLPDCLSFYPYFDNDIIVNNSPLYLFQSYSNNFPNVSNFPNLNDFRMTFDENFYLPSISNFSSIRSKTITITHSFKYLLPFYIDSNPYFSEIYIFAKFEKPNSFFNLSSHGYKKMSLGYVGDQFNINGEIPIIPSPNSYHLINYGNFTTFPNLSLYNGDISISISNLEINLPVYIGKNQNIILASNRLKGTIDESWCNSLLIIRNNTLSGEIPSCFTCYFSDPQVFNSFAGNQFSNYNKSIGCPNFAPRFEPLKNSSQVFFRVTGTNIGYYPNYWLLNSYGFVSTYDVISMGYEYIVRFSSAYPYNPKYFNITFQHPQPSHTITYPVNKSLPTPSSLQITSNVYLFTGQFFSSYMGYTNQSVVIGGSNNCSIKNTTFFSMTCGFDSSTSSLSYPTIVDITNDNLLRRVIINPQIGNFNQVKCPNDCDDLNGSICDLTQGICFFLNCTYDCGAFGTCNNRTGVCDCNYNHQGQNCSLPFVQCPIGSNSLICSGDDNHCNNQTGVCVCDANHQGQSCSVPLKKCPIGLNSLVCSGGTNYCNNQTGICSCDSNLQGLDCSLPYKQCPIGVNSLICNGGFNSCNNQTGLCKCDPNHQGNDCSIPYKQCPLGMDSLICSGGFNSCNNQTGECNCDPKYQGADCSIPFKQCPVGDNSLICSGGFNSCNNQTGVCKCDPNHQGNDCSIPFKQCPLGLNSLICSGGLNSCNNQTGVCDCDPKYQGADCSIPFKQCPVGDNSLICSGDFNSCNNQTGVCKCDQNHQGNDCSIPFKQCPLGMDSLICSGDLNSCNNQTGVCNCEPNSQGSDCSIPFKQCPVGLDSLICSGGNSHCNNQTGVCNCDFKYTTNDCSKPNQYISSVLPSNTTGGEASFNGWFGDIHSNLSLLIGNKQCSPITFNSSNEIKCIAPPGKGVYNIIINQNEIEYQLKDGYSYIELIGTCPNNCTNSNQGICNTSNSQCSCINDYYSFDCSLKKNNNNGGGGNTGNNSTVDPSTGITNFTDSQVNFQIYFKNLFEIDFNGNIINKYSLKSNWTFNKTKDNQTNNIYKLEQTIQQSCQIISTIEEVSTSKEYSFAGSTFTLDAGSIKLTISISNYTYKSNLNTLQLQLISSVDDQNEESNCNTKESSTNEISSSSFKYIKISKDNRVLQGRFINKVLSDGRSTYLSTDIKSDGNTVVATLNLPHFVNQSIIDPDFSVLLDTDFKSECNSENNRKWLIPVSVIVPVVGVSCIGGILYFIYIKKAIENPLKIKLKTLLRK